MVRRVIGWDVKFLCNAASRSLSCVARNCILTTNPRSQKPPGPDFSWLGTLKSPGLTFEFGRPFSVIVPADGIRLPILRSGDFGTSPFFGQVSDSGKQGD